MLDLHSAIYVWKGRGATLDARNVGLQLGVCAHFTCFAGTAVQILTQNVLLARDLSSSREQPPDAVARLERGALRTCPVVRVCGSIEP